LSSVILCMYVCVCLHVVYIACLHLIWIRVCVCVYVCMCEGVFAVHIYCDYKVSLAPVEHFIWKYANTRLVIGTSRTVGSAKKFVRITSGFGGGEFTKTRRKVCTCQKFKLSFLLLEYCKIRECYAVANAFTIRNMYSLFLYMKCNSRKINRLTKNMTKIVTLLHF
jgi:hypothetical protein